MHLGGIRRRVPLTNVGVKNKFQFEDFIFLVRYRILLEKNVVNKNNFLQNILNSFVRFAIFWSFSLI